MDYGCIKNGRCVNVIVMRENAEKMIPLIINQQGLDEIIALPEGYGIGDIYQSEAWEHRERKYTRS